MRPLLLTRVTTACFGVFAALAPAHAGWKTLPGHVPPVVSQLAPVGDVDPAQTMTLAIGLPLRDTNGLNNFLAQVYNPASQNYRHYLTPQQFTDRFGPTAQDYAAVMGFLRTHHLTVTKMHDNRLLVDVTGKAADVQKAFSIHLHNYQHPTESRLFFAPDSDPVVDDSLPIADVSGLNNYWRPHPRNLHLDTRQAPRSGSGAGGGYMGGDFRAAYLPGVALTGTGETVGLLEFDGFYAADIANYESTAGLPAVPIQTVLLDNYSGTPTTGSDSGNPEVSLDIEMAISLAPGLSQVVSFEAGPDGDQNDVLNAMAASNQIKQFSCSWGWGGGPSTTTDNIFKEMQSQGQSFFNAAGDSDAFTVGANSANGVDNTSLANAPSSSPYITQVGATTLSTSGPGGSWTGETVWNWGLHDGSYVGTSGGVSSHYAIPSWQTNVNMSSNGGSTTYRNIPDVALTGDNITVIYGNGSTDIFGGTSCAAPLWAALTALCNEQSTLNGGTNVGFVNPAIYALGESASYGALFHDIVTGNNTSSDSPSNYYAVAGYDLCTGWGTPAGEALIDALAGSPPALILSPMTGFAVGGVTGGPFTATNETFVVSNATSSNITWAAFPSVDWLSVSNGSGTLAPSNTALFEVSLNTNADALGIGSYSASVLFTNMTDGTVEDIGFGLSVVSPYQSIVQNGGFETGTFADWTLVGDTIVTSRHTEEIYDAVESTSFDDGDVVHSGNYGAALGDNKIATLTQTLNTVPGQTYLLSFWLANLPNEGVGSGEIFAVNWNSSLIYGATNSPSFSWTNLQFLVTTTNASTPLQFQVENVDSYFALDDVSVTPVPSVGFQNAAVSGGNLNLSWSTAPGLTYQVQYTDDLTLPAWTNLGPPTLATGTTLSLSETNISLGDPQRFYRLVLSP